MIVYLLSFLYAFLVLYFQITSSLVLSGNSSYLKLPPSMSILPENLSTTFAALSSGWKWPVQGEILPLKVPPTERPGFATSWLEVTAYGSSHPNVDVDSIEVREGTLR